MRLAQRAALQRTCAGKLMHRFRLWGAARQQHVGGGGFTQGGWRQKFSDHWRRSLVWGGLGGMFGLPLAIDRIWSDAALCKEQLSFTKLKNLEERFVNKSVLGEGGQAIVYRALDKLTGKMVAVKVTKKDHPQGHALVFSELELMMSIGRHANLTSLQGAFETDDSWIIVMDMADGGALFERIIDKGVLSEELASDYIMQVAEALMHMHHRGVAHGDIKPENLLLCSSSDENASIKLCDFGMARPLSPSGFAFSYTCGTFDYWAPEVVRQEKCTEAIDMWALGVVMYIMLCGCNPFDPSAVASDQEILSNISNCKMDMHNAIWRHLSPDCKDLVQGLLQSDATKRLTAVQVLMHPWVVEQQTTAALPSLQLHRLRGFQAVSALRSATRKLQLSSDAMFDAIDSSSSGLLSVHELKTLFDLIHTHTHRHTHIDTHTHTHTYTHIGEVSVHELKKLFGHFGVTLSEEALAAVREMVDTNRDGRVQRSEFVNMLRLADR
jgi:serine/threonine protein kinase